MEDGRQLNLVWCLIENCPDWSYRQTCLRTIVSCNEAGQRGFRSLLEENYFVNTSVRVWVRSRVYPSVTRARESDWEKTGIPFFFFFFVLLLLLLLLLSLQPFVNHRLFHNSTPPFSVLLLMSPGPQGLLLRIFPNWLGSSQFSFSHMSISSWFKESKLSALFQFLPSKEMSQPPQISNFLTITTPSSS